ncbi:MAG: SusD/RagB family nutrient-binding outer membrane lipoprotein [Chitinophagaceae bacterium]|nr:SusD/RagB family nutrient-binding outer membrane lipoprotein [Chitinophagaceae bacterium]
MKKIIVFSISLLLFGSCTKDLASLNNDPKNPTVVPSYALFSSAQKNMADALSSPNVNLNIFRLLTQQWTETTYTDESNYDLNQRNIPRGWWNTFYRDVLKNFEEAKKLIPTDVADPAQVKNEVAMADIMEVVAYYHLITTFGNIPYTEALDYNKPRPKYDDAKTIYADLLKRLDTDIAALNTGAVSFGSSDLLYGGDVASWKKFANSFKLKMGILLADSDPATAKAVVEAAAPNVFTSSNNNAMFAYLSSPPNTNQIWVNLVQSGRKDFVGANTLVDAMKGLNDPRLSLFFTTDANGDFSGGIYGASNSYATFSKPSDKITAPDFPLTLLSYSEIEFILAEAVEREYNVPGTALVHYNNAVSASIKEWGGSSSDASVFLTQPSVNYLSAPGTYKQKIGIQKWIGLYNRGYDSWTEWRRLDYPQLIAPTSALTVIPLRYTYSVDEQNINTVNYNSASTAIGGDKVTTKLFFDKY